MRRLMVFASRNNKELLRDPLNYVFALALPLLVMILLRMIGANVPETIFPIETLAPGIAVFGLSFITLFAGILISKDRSTSFLVRLCASPLSSSEFVGGYILPMFPLAIAQIAICLSASILLGLDFSLNVFLALLALIPVAALFIGLGILLGTLLNDKQVGGICGALLTNLCAWLSGAWFDLSLVGGVFERIAYLLPFAHAVDAGRAALAGDYASMVPHICWTAGYAIVILAAAIWVFKRKMKNAGS